MGTGAMDELGDADIMDVTKNESSGKRTDSREVST